MATATGQTNVLNLLLGIGVPVSDGTSLGIGLQLPLIGSSGPMLSVTGNWALLFGGGR